MMKILIILVSFMCCLNISSVHALSCAAPVLDETALESAMVVFEGASQRVRDLTRKERQVLKSRKIVGRGGSLESLKVFDFVVVKGWKGAEEGDRIQIVRNTYWGDIFTEDEKYFILSSQKIDDLYMTHLCDHTMNIQYIEDYGFLKILKEAFVEKKRK